MRYQVNKPPLRQHDFHDMGVSNDTATNVLSLPLDEVKRVCVGSIKEYSSI